MFLIVGLGNPGREYAATRHNIGFLFLDHLAAVHGLVFRGSRWQADIAKGAMWHRSLVLVKPQTYMNLSGGATGQVARFYQLEPRNIIVVHDDLDLEFGRVKVVAKRGAGGHNGVRSIIDHLGTRDFVRVRVGIGRPPEEGAAQYVLDRFSKEEKECFSALFQDIERAVRLIVTQGVTEAMNRVNAEK